VRREGLGELKKFNDLIGNRILDVLACSIAITSLRMRSAWKLKSRLACEAKTRCYRLEIPLSGARGECLHCLTRLEVGTRLSSGGRISIATLWPDFVQPSSCAMPNDRESCQATSVPPSSFRFPPIVLITRQLRRSFSLWLC
jgi:hypothetical protein